MPQICTHRVTLIDKGIKYQCSFFVVPGNRTALLGMPDWEHLQLLSINCQRDKKLQEEGKLRSKHIKISPNQATVLKIRDNTNNKTNQKIADLIAGAAMETGREVSTKNNIKIHKEYGSVCTAIGCMKGTFPLLVKDNVKPYRCP